MDIDRRILTRASFQHGVVTIHDLRAAGLSHREVAVRAEAGWLQRVHPGVYRIGGSVWTFEQATLAACRAIGGTVAASHRCAAVLWGLELPEPAPIEVSTGSTRSSRLPGVIVHRSGDLVEEHITRRRGVRVTKPARTLVDLGAVVPAEVLAHAFDDLLSRRVVTIGGVRRILDSTATRGRPGVGPLRRLLESRLDDSFPSRSRLEHLLIEIASAAGLPRPEFQFPILLGGQRRRVDFAFPVLRIAVEVDGYEFHTGYEVFQDDRVRGNELELAGWTVLHFTWAQVRHRPDYVIATLRRALLAA